jgi:hypothetical protein
MRKSGGWTPSIVPHEDQNVYLVMDDFGRLRRVWREADAEHTDLETVIQDLLEMNRLQKFIEQGEYGERSGRVVYVLRLDTLPDASEGMTWQNVQPFSAADDLLENASLRDVFKAAIANGCAVIPGAD